MKRARTGLTAQVANRRQSRQWPAHNCRSTAALAKWKIRRRVLEWRERCRRSVSRRVRHPRVRSLMSRTGEVPRIFTRAQPKNRALLPRTGGEKRARDRKHPSGFTPARSSSCGTRCRGAQRGGSSQVGWQGTRQGRSPQTSTFGRDCRMQNPALGSATHHRRPGRQPYGRISVLRSRHADAAFVSGVFF